MEYDNTLGPDGWKEMAAPTREALELAEEILDKHETCFHHELARRIDSHVAEATAALRAELERYKRALRRRGLSPAPCDICGYNGAGYYQPSQHECAALEDTK